MSGTVVYCLFRFPHPWPLILKAARKDIAEGIELLDANDRALDDWLRARALAGIVQPGWDIPHQAVVILPLFMSEKPGDRVEALRMLAENEESLVDLFRQREWYVCL